jgi:hypothetical protein
MYAYLCILNIVTPTPSSSVLFSSGCASYLCEWFKYDQPQQSDTPSPTTDFCRAVESVAVPVSYLLPEMGNWYVNGFSGKCAKKSVCSE